MPYDNAESVLVPLQMSSGGVDNPLPGASRLPVKHLIYEGVPRDQVMKIHSPSGHPSIVVSKHPYKTSHFSKQKDRDNRGKGSLIDGDSDIKEDIISESNGNAVEAKKQGDMREDNSLDQFMLSEINDEDEEKSVVDVKNCGSDAHLKSRPQPSYCTSPVCSLYAASHYTEAKQSFTNTELTSECASSVWKYGGGSDQTSDVCDFIEGRKASIYRGCASISSNWSEDSSSSNSIFSATSKPHSTNDKRWEAIQAVRARNNGALELQDFRILNPLGVGDIGTVRLCELVGTGTYFAVKMMDKENLVTKKKILRAQTENEILQCLDHPFLPTLYTHFETNKGCYLVMEFCPGGDLHALRQKQPGKFFPEHAAR